MHNKKISKTICDIFAGTGDLAVDMENQVKANSVRIQILEEQNLKLRNTVTKMLQRQKLQGQVSDQSKFWIVWETFCVYAMRTLLSQDG